MAVHLSSVNSHAQVEAIDTVTWAAPAQYTLLTEFSLGTTDTTHGWGFSFRAGNAPSGNPEILAYRSDPGAPFISTTMVNYVKDSAPVLLYGTTWELVIEDPIPMGTTYYNLSYKTLNTAGNAFFPTFCNTSTQVYSAGYTTILTGPLTGAYKIMSMYVTPKNQAANTYDLFITNASIATPPTDPIPYIQNAVTYETIDMLGGQNLYLTSGQNLVFYASAGGDLSITITYAVVV